MQDPTDAFVRSLVLLGMTVLGGACLSVGLAKASWPAGIFGAATLLCSLLVISIIVGRSRDH